MLPNQLEVISVLNMNGPLRITKFFGKVSIKDVKRERNGERRRKIINENTERRGI